jgi:hypothetical protein
MSEIVIIHGRKWVMTDIPAPDYSKTIFRPHPFKFKYRYASKTNDTERAEPKWADLLNGCRKEGD